MNTITHKFHVVGMHCKSCILLTESEIGSHPDVQAVKAKLDDSTIEVTGDFGERQREHLVEELSTLIEKHGYSLSLEKPVSTNKWSEFKIAAPVALGIILLFYALQKMGIVNLVNTDSLNYSAAFVVGIIASLSSCMAVVGGLLLSMSATYAKEGQKVRPQLMFHIGRLVSFFILGGVIGAIGSAFSLNAMATFVLGTIVALVMLAMGLNLLGITRWMPSMPRFVSKNILNSHAPFLIGVATFFLPCGFTQAMQFYTLSTGSFLSGGLTMLAFALGTLPALALVSFSSLSIMKSSKSGIFFKTAGLVVIVFALFNILNSLAAIGIINPIFNI